jgi:hypothetical protein
MKAALSHRTAVQLFSRWRRAKEITICRAAALFCVSGSQVAKWEWYEDPIPAYVFVAIETIQNVNINVGRIHYVYKLTDAKTGQFYYGARSCYGRAADDAYSGSGAWKERTPDLGISLIKEILSFHPSHNAAVLTENGLLRKHRNHPLCVNRQAGGARKRSVVC